MFVLVVISAFALTICPAMYGQATGSFSGTVLDKSRSSVSGAIVTATSQSLTTLFGLRPSESRIHFRPGIF
jgi:hypothetical protein